MTDQLTLPIDAPPVNTARRERIMHTFKRNCEFCEKEYDAVYKNSRFCCHNCKRKGQRRTLRMLREQESYIQTTPSIPPVMNKPEQPKPVAPIKEVSDEKIDKTEKKIKSIRPKFSNLPADVSIGVSLLERELDRMERMYEEERAKRKKIQGKYEELKDRTKDEKHAQQLAGIEAAKPDVLDRIIAGVGQLPQPILEQLAPALGRLVNKMMPGDEGVAGQLQGSEIDPMTAQLIQWIAAQPEQQRELLLHVIGKLMGLEQDKLSATLMQFLNLLQNGSTLSGPESQPSIQPQPGYDEKYYAFGQ